MSAETAPGGPAAPDSQAAAAPSRPEPESSVPAAREQAGVFEETRVPRRAESSAPSTAVRVPAVAAPTSTPKPSRKETRRPAPKVLQRRAPDEDVSAAPSATARHTDSATVRTPVAEAAVPAPKPAGGPPPPAVLAAYEAGDVAGALSRARSSGHAELAARLERFQRAYEGGKQALARRDGNAAIRQFADAAKEDEGISKGWGTYGPELRARLTRLYAAAGKQKAQAGDAAGARKAFQAALRYDASNAEARAGLDAL